MGEAATCPDGLCDLLEEQEPSLCPQDCVDHHKIILSLLVNTDPPLSRGIPSVKAPNMTCKCEPSSCQCFHSRYEEEEEEEEEEVTALTSHLSPCDDHCILLLTASASLGLASLLLMTGIWRKRESLCSRYVKDKAKVCQYEEGFTSELEDYSRKFLELKLEDFLFAIAGLKTQRWSHIQHKSRR